MGNSHKNLLLRNHWANCKSVKIDKSSKFIKNSVIYVKKLIIIQFKLGTFWLKIEQFWPFEGISLFSMARNSLTYIPGFSVKFFFQPIYTDYANFDKRSHLNLLL
jgi:hypothetical protein